MSSVDLRRARQRAERARWRTLVAEAQSSGRGPTEFCRLRGLNVSQYYYWRRVLSLETHEQSYDGRFALVGHDVVVQGCRDEPALEVEMDDGWRLHIRPGADEATLRLVIDALRRKP